jgi:hypothetical protein
MGVESRTSLPDLVRSAAPSPVSFPGEPSWDPASVAAGVRTLGLGHLPAYEGGDR